MGEFRQQVPLVESKPVSEPATKKIKGEVPTGSSSADKIRRADLREKFIKETQLGVTRGLEDGKVSDDETN